LDHPVCGFICVRWWRHSPQMACLLFYGYIEWPWQ